MQERHIPNWVSFSRIIPGLPLSLFCIYFEQYKLALLCVAFFAFTDWLDGYLARRLGIVTDFGEAIDPIADKVFYLGTLLLLGLPEGFSLLTTPLFIFEGILLGIGLRGLQRALFPLKVNYQKKLIPIGANRWGKTKVCFEITLIVTLIFQRMGLMFPWYWFLFILTGATVCAALSIGKKLLQKMT